MYIVVSLISQGQQVVDRRPLDAFREERKYALTQEQRKQVLSIWNHAKFEMRKVSVGFARQLTLCSEEAKGAIEEIHAEANTKLKQIHPALSARVYFLPIETLGGELGLMVRAAMMKTLYSETIEKLEKLLEHGGVRSRNAIVRLLARLRQMTIVEDTRAKELIDAIDAIRSKSLNEAQALLSEIKKAHEELLASGLLLDI